MNTYIICFEIYGKRMKTTVEADTIYEAKQQIKDKIIYHSVTPNKNNKPPSLPDDEDPIEFLKSIFKMK